MIPATAPPDVAAPPALPAPLREEWRRLAAPAPDAPPFTPDMLDGLPGPARRWLRRAIAPGTALRRAAVLHQHGTIKVGRWLHYEADWLLAPAEGFIWAATADLGPFAIRGFDRYTGGTGEMRWRVLGAVPVLSATGADVDRSAAGRLAAEFCFVPAVALSPAVSWEPFDDRRAVAHVSAQGWTHRVTVTVAGSGRLERVDVPRWGGPDRKPAREHLFTALLSRQELAVDGFTIPRGAGAGWWHCHDRCATEEFIRFSVDDAVYR